MKKNPLKFLSTLTQLGVMSFCACAALSATAGTYEPKDYKAPPAPPRFYLSLASGAEIQSNSTHYMGSGDALIFSNCSETLPILLGYGHGHPIGFKKAYEPAVFGRVDLGYNVFDWVSLFAGFTWERANGRRAVSGGTLYDFCSSTFLPAYYNFDRYESYAGHGGFRLELPVAKWLNWNWLDVFFTYTAGGKWVSQSHIIAYAPGFLPTPWNFTVPGNGSNRLYSGAWVFTNDGLLGLETRVWGFKVGVEGGVGYDTKLGRPVENKTVGAYSYSRDGDRLYFPIALYSKIDF